MRSASSFTWGTLQAHLFVLFPSAGVAVGCLQTTSEVADLFGGAGWQNSDWRLVELGKRCELALFVLC